MKAFADSLRPLAITLLRLALGVVFLYHGVIKLTDLPHWRQFFLHVGFPAWTAYLIGALETAGGALLILGKYSRVVALLLAGEMLVAVLKVHLPSGPFWRVTDFELPMLLSAASFWLFTHGPGPWSLDGN